MNKILLFLSLLLVSFASCNKDEVCDCAKNGNCQCQNNSQNDNTNNEENVDNEDNDVYYIKYYATISTVYSGNIGYVTVGTPNGGKEISLRTKTYEETYGPVKKGFCAKISVSNTTSNIQTVSCKIMISKNNGPFAVQAEGNGDAGAGCSYVIDF